MAGVLLAYLDISNNNKEPNIFFKKLSPFISMAGIILLTVSFMYFNNDSLPWLANGTAVLGTVFIIFSGSSSFTNKHLLSNKTPMFFGAISYPLYLWHWPLIVFGKLFFNADSNKIVMWSVLVLSNILAYLTWQFVEKPIRERRWASKSVLWIVIMMICVTLSAEFIIQKEGSFGYASTVNPLNFNSRNGPLRDKACQSRFWPEEKENNLFMLCSHASSNPSIAIIGDSHAHHIYECVKNYYQSKNIDVIAITTSGCPLFFEKDNCQFLYKKIFEKVEKIRSIKTIILSEHNSFFYEQNTDMWIKNVRDMLTKTQKRYQKIILHLDNPDHTEHPRTLCYPRPYFLTSKSLEEKCSIQRIDKNLSDLYKKSAQIAIQGFDNVTIFDAAEPFCDKDKCKMIINGQLLYRDQHHLNYFGSLYLSKFYNWEKEINSLPGSTQQKK